MLADALRPDAFAAALKRRRRALPRHDALRRRSVGRNRRTSSRRRPTSGSTVRGNYRFREQNDRDGGREVVPLRARARRCATLWEDDPPRRRGARAQPVARRGAGRAVRGVRSGRRAMRVVTHSRAPSWSAARARRCSSCSRATARRRSAAPALDGLRNWRSNASIEALSGRMVVDDATGALRALPISRRTFASRRGDAEARRRGPSTCTRRSTEVAATAAIETPGRRGSVDAAAHASRAARAAARARADAPGGRADAPGRTPEAAAARTSGRAGHDGAPATRTARQRHERRRATAAGAGAADAGRGRDPGGVEHLAENRRLIVRRALLATAVGGVIPIPVLDDYFAGPRARRACSMKLAERRQVDLAPVVGRAARRSARGERRCATRR